MEGEGGTWGKTGTILTLYVLLDTTIGLYENKFRTTSESYWTLNGSRLDTEH